MLNIRYYILNTLYISYIYTYLRASGEERKVRKGGHGRETSQKKIWLRQHFSSHLEEAQDLGTCNVCIKT